MKPIILITVLFLASCANELEPSLPYYMAKKNLPAVRVDNFPHCQGYGCPTHKNVVLNKRDWSLIEKAFGKKAKSAKDERAKIARAIGAFERVVGPLTGTADDKRGTFIQTGKGQLDCVDESTNTTIYIMLLKEKGLVAFHDIRQPQVRWPLISGRGWMHQTAVVEERGTGAQFAVDSWFEDNGANAWIVPIDTWRAGWHPQMQDDDN